MLNYLLLMVLCSRIIKLYSKNHNSQLKSHLSRFFLNKILIFRAKNKVRNVHDQLFRRLCQVKSMLDSESPSQKALFAFFV